MNTSQRSESKKGDRPFPWKCPACLQREVYPHQLDYTTTIKHDGLLVDLHLPTFEVPKCRVCGELLFNDLADQQINVAIRSHLQLLSPEEIRQHREALDWTTTDLAERLNLSASAVIRWENGSSIQSQLMDEALRLHLTVLTRALNLR